MATNPLTSWREQVATVLAAAFPDADVLAGERDDTPSRDQDVISIYAAATSAAGDVNFARPRLTIRYFVKQPTLTVFSQPQVPDEEPLENALWQVLQALQANRLVVDDDGNTVLIYELAQALPLREKYAIEIHLLAWVVNPSGNAAR